MNLNESCEEEGDTQTQTNQTTLITHHCYNIMIRSEDTNYYCDLYKRQTGSQNPKLKNIHFPSGT